MATQTTAGPSEGSLPPEQNIRMKRFNDALAKFLELLDERATATNFQVALPHLDQNLLDSARKQFVFHLKDAIKMEKDRLVQSYKLDERLAELDELTREADKRNEEARRKRTTARALHHDAWREGIDLDTAIHAPLIPQSKRRIAALEEELKEITVENEEGFLKLSDTLKEEKSRRQAAKDSLTWLEETVRTIEASEEESQALTDSIAELLAEMGPRAIL